MHRRVTLAAVVAAVASTLGIGAAPAAAESVPANTTVTFSIGSAGLTISAPGTAALGSGVSGGFVSGNIGPVTVTDGRGSRVAAWTATVSSTSYITGSGTPAETIPASAAVYNPGPVTDFSGAPFAVRGRTGDLGSARTAYSATAIGSNSVTWEPNLKINLPAAAVVGDYSGTVTHSVA